MLYSLVIKETHLDLVTALNSGITPAVEEDKTMFIIFNVDEGKICDTKIVTKDEYESNYYLGGGPILRHVEEAIKTKTS